jgi:predicted nucleotidyltransferase component of viral defense system
MKDSPFYQQAELVVRIMPFIYQEEVLAIKGGSAINYFIRNLPRLSVDIDLTYVPLKDRVHSLTDISETLNRISEKIQQNIPNTSIKSKRTKGKVSSLFIQRESLQIKVEANTVIRGTVFPCLEKVMCEEARTLFNQSPKAKISSIPDLYGGKICAALDRQHPRDFFDIRLLLEKEGLTEEIRKAFVVFLISHSRPMAELLEPSLKDIRSIFGNEFQGMTRDEVTLKQLIDARDTLIKCIHSDLTSNERRFILSVKECKPDWKLLGLDGIDRLPAVQWKLHNLERMDRKKHAEAVERLKRCLNL